MQKWHDEKKPHRENSDPGKVWMAKGVRRCQNKDDLLCKSGTVQGMQLSRTVSRTGTTEE
jgi:hypothetical protein